MRQQAGCENLTSVRRKMMPYFYKDPKGVSNWLLLQNAMIPHEYGILCFIWDLRSETASNVRDLLFG